MNFRPRSRLTVYLQALAGAARVRTRVSMRMTSTIGLPTASPFPIPGLPDLTTLFPNLETTATRMHALARVGAGVTFAATERVGFRLGLDYGGLFGDASPPGGARLMGGLAFGF